ncbi:MAG: O-antigen ligase family protein [Ruminococcaceae bacterium]|nr:O-antigen ligase family protein [Oscillospiraceae bacterium]
MSVLGVKNTKLWDAVCPMLVLALCLIYTLRTSMLFLACAFVIFFFQAQRNFSVISIRKPYIWLLAFYAYAMFVTLLADDLREGWTKEIIKIIWTFLIIECLPKKALTYDFFIKLFKVFMVVCFLLGIVEYFVDYSIWDFLGMEVQQFAYLEGRISVIFYNPLVYSHFILVGLWCEMAFSYKSKALHWGYLGLGFLNLVFTEARSSWAIFLICVLIYLAINVRVKITEKKVIFFLFYAMALIALIIVFREQLGELFAKIFERLGETSSKDNSFIQRWGTVRNAVRYFIENPAYGVFGRGFGYSTIFMMENQVLGEFLSPDNQYVTYSLNYGLIGTVLFFVSFLPDVLRALKRKDRFSQFLVYNCVTLLLFFLFYDAMGWISARYLFCLIFHLAIFSKKMGRETQEASN